MTSAPPTGINGPTAAAIVAIAPSAATHGSSPARPSSPTRASDTTNVDQPEPPGGEQGPVAELARPPDAGAVGLRQWELGEPDHERRPSGEAGAGASGQPRTPAVSEAPRQRADQHEQARRQRGHGEVGAEVVHLPRAAEVLLQTGDVDDVGEHGDADGDDREDRQHQERLDAERRSSGRPRRPSPRRPTVRSRRPRTHRAPASSAGRRRSPSAPPPGAGSGRSRPATAGCAPRAPSSRHPPPASDRAVRTAPGRAASRAWRRGRRRPRRRRRVGGERSRGWRRQCREQLTGHRIEHRMPAGRRQLERGCRGRVGRPALMQAGTAVHAEPLFGTDLGPADVALHAPSLSEHVAGRVARCGGDGRGRQTLKR